MDNLNFYDEIGHGRLSTVYKGRQKRSVEFVAIRRVERSHRSKILAEVQALHSLDHANVLKFHAWFASAKTLLTNSTRRLGSYEWFFTLAPVFMRAHAISPPMRRKVCSLTTASATWA